MWKQQEKIRACIRQVTPGVYNARFGACTLSSVFQPIYTNTGLLHGYEALLRITDSKGMAINPFEFLYRTPRSGDESTFLSLLTSALHVRNFSAAKQDCKLFLNIHPRMLDYIVRADEIAPRLNELGISLDQVVVEILEHEAPSDTKLVYSVEKLKQLGCTIAIDDFGMASSNAQRASLIKPDIIKIDKRLKDLYLAGEPAELLEALLVASNVGAMVVIECIEDLDEYRTFSGLFIPFLQGYYLGRPAPLPVPIKKVS